MTSAISQFEDEQSLEQVKAKISRFHSGLRIGCDDEIQRSLRVDLTRLYSLRDQLQPKLQRGSAGTMHGRSAKPARELLPDAKRVRIHFLGLCNRCGHRHHEWVDPHGFMSAVQDWNFKHRWCEIEQSGCVETQALGREFPKGFDDRNVEKLGKGPWWLTYKHNANIKVAFAADAAITMDLSALAASSTLVIGRESTSINNTSNLYLDYVVSGNVISGTTPTAGGEMRVAYVQPYEDTPSWPDGFSGSDSGQTLTNTAIRDKYPIGWSGDYSTTSNVTYPIVSALTLAQAFGVVPNYFLIYFAHSMTAALKTDAGNTNSFNQRGVYATSI